MRYNLFYLAVALLVVFGCTIPDPTPIPVQATILPTVPPTTELADQPDPHISPQTQPTLSSNDLLYLARLCVMEARGMSDGMRDVACLSVISTAMTRTKIKFLSDGTLASTLSWHSGGTWQFAGYLVDGCRDDMPTKLCPDNWTIDIKRFEEVIRISFRDEGFRRVMTVCDGYLYYNSIPGGNVDCLLDDRDSGQYIQFYKKANTEVAPVIIRSENIPQ